jgi:hypothetical protein
VYIASMKERPERICAEHQRLLDGKIPTSLPRPPRFDDILLPPTTGNETLGQSASTAHPSITDYRPAMSSVYMPRSAQEIPNVVEQQVPQSKTPQTRADSSSFEMS